MHVAKYFGVVSGWEERKKRRAMHVKREKNEKDHAETLYWSNACPDFGKAPMFLYRISESVRSNC